MIRIYYSLSIFIGSLLVPVLHYSIQKKFQINILELQFHSIPLGGLLIGLFASCGGYVMSLVSRTAPSIFDFIVMTGCGVLAVYLIDLVNYITVTQNGSQIASSITFQQFRTFSRTLSNVDWEYASAAFGGFIMYLKARKVEQPE